jgi:hypothetical protein
MFRNLQMNRTPGWTACLAALLCCAAASADAPSVPATPQELARRHLDTLAAAAQARNDETLCAALASADRTQQALGQDLNRRRDAIFEQSAGEAALQALDRSAAEAVTRLPGVGLSVGAETVYHYVRYGALAPYAPKASGAGLALRLSEKIWPDPSGLPVYIEQISDVTGCLQPAALLPPLRELAAAWRSVPACLKAQLGPRLAAAAQQAAGPLPNCTAEAENAAAVAEIRSLSRVLAHP